MGRTGARSPAARDIRQYKHIRPDSTARRRTGAGRRGPPAPMRPGAARGGAEAAAPVMQRVPDALQQRRAAIVPAPPGATRPGPA